MSVLRRLKRRGDDSYKGQNGRVLVVAGSIEYPGAAVLAGLAVLRSGVDLCYLCVPESIACGVSSYSPDLIVKRLYGDFLRGSHVDDILDLAKKCQACLIGPGLSEQWETRQAVNRLIEELDIPIILDADGLKLVHALPDKEMILTPHKNEFVHLFDEEGKGNLLKHSSERRIILLKGMEDMIADGKKVYYNKAGNAGMTVGGTGDVLGGLCAGFVAQGNSLLISATCAAELNGMAGDLLYEKKGYAFLASDLLDVIPKILGKWLK